MRKRGAVVWLVVVLVGWAAGASAESPLEKRLRVLEEQLRKSQQEIQELRGQIQQQKAIGQATQKQAEDAQEQAKAATTQSAKTGGEVPAWLKRTTLFGDVRTRFEGFYNQPTTAGNTVTARNRERIRARLGVTVVPDDEVSATIRVATGNPNDPISTNEDLGGSWTRKHVNLDWAYLNLTPGKTFGIRPGLLSVLAGKFPNTMFRVGEMVWDDDLSPEGATETVSLLAKPVGFLDQVRVHALQWTFAEVSNSADGWMLGAQVNPVMHVGSTQIEAGIGQYGWDNPDLIAQQFNSNSSLKTTNLLVTQTVSGKKTVTGFRSGFLQTNPNVQVTFPNVVAAQPVRLFFDYVRNWRAATAANDGWYLGAKVGQTKVKGDWSFFGVYERLMTDGTLAPFSYSDFGPGGTNLQGPIVGAEYQLLNPLTLSVKSSFTNYIDRPAGSSNPTLTRLLVDAMVKF